MPAPRPCHAALTPRSASFGAGAFALVLLMGVVAPRGALAHDFWIMPSAFHAQPGERIDAALRVGMAFEGDPILRRPERIVRFEAVLGTTALPIVGGPLADPAGSFIPESPGLHALIYRSNRARIELDARKFEDYLREEGLDHIIDRRRELGQSETAAIEVYSRCCKSLVLVGQDAAALDTFQGLDLEIVVTSRLRDLAPGAAVGSVLLFDGEPLAGTLVTAMRRGDPSSAVSARTDELGRTSLAIDAPGVWMLKAIHMDTALADVASETDANWESTWTTTTFEIAPDAPRVPEPLDAAPRAYPDYELVWRDEFNADGPPDPANWINEIGFVRNREAQWYQPDNAVVEDGRLAITARREQAQNPSHDPDAPESDWKRSRTHAEYTSASIKTRGLHEWTFGRFEMRGRIDIRRGMWPAFWTVGVGREWPGCGELDIMEFYQRTLLANAAWGSERRYAGVWDDSKTPIDRVASDAGY